jgi:low affinity Fe/Cu permease
MGHHGSSVQFFGHLAARHNTGTTIVTFLMVFLIQSTQNRDGLAIQIKLDELVRALENANNKFVGIEKLTEDEVKTLRQETPTDPGQH